MGAYLGKPVTDKVSECGEFTVGSRKVLFGATAMQGWRIGMEDAHCIDSKFDDKSSLLAVYDGHGGREVAVYCAAHLGDIIKATKAYSTGDIGLALKDAFMKCDNIIVAEEAVKEMKKIVEDDMSKIHSNEAEDIDTLIEEAHMPLNALLARYKGRAASNEAENFENSRVGNTKEDGIKAVLQLVASQTGLQFEFDNSDSDSDSQDENSDIDQMVGHQEDEEPNNLYQKEQSPITSEHRPPVFSNISLESLLSSKPVSQPTLRSNGTLSLATEESKPHRQKDQTSERNFNEANPCENMVLASDEQPLNQATGIELTSQSSNDKDLEHNSSDKTVDRSISGAHIRESRENKSNKEALNAAQKYEQDKHVNASDTSELSSSSISDNIQLVSNPSPTDKGHLSSNPSPNDSTHSSSKPSCSDIHLSTKPSPSAKEHIPNQNLPCSNAQSSEVKISREHGLMHLLTSAVQNNTSPQQVESSLQRSDPGSSSWESRINPRKRPHPEDDGENDGLDRFVPKRPEIVDDEGYHSGTTAVVAVLSEDMITVANAGDSRCVASLKGTAMDLSFDHKPTDLPELQRIEKAGGIVGLDGRVNGGLNLSRAIGDHFYKANTSLPLEEQMITAMPDIQTLAITEEVEFVVLACDGIWNSKTSQEVIDFVRCRLSERTHDRPPTSDDLVGICESLCDACLAPDTDNDGTGCDNMTCIIALLSWS